MKYISIFLCALLCTLLVVGTIIANDNDRDDRRAATQDHQRVTDVVDHTKAESPVRARQYRLSGTTDAVSGYSTSDSYGLVSVINQPEPVGEQQSDNYRLFPGMLAPQFNANTRAFVGNPTLGVENPNPVSITEYRLYQNAPNPFNPITHITYDIAEAGLVTLKVYNITGREVATLVNEVQPQNRYTVPLNMAQFASGIYFYRLQTPNFIATKKMVLLK